MVGAIFHDAAVNVITLFDGEVMIGEMSAASVT